ncbi:hypothetical protein FG87_34750 [Nocardia vulneris]|uniref:TrbC/VIRB2 family protein n=2 Tax=Nocardia vulneris TaxID=1141657 RepID=A0ABR4Z714_9NOCA|nr:hypothetical protein FG87_34750 [Nocardia vulneris]
MVVVAATAVACVVSMAGSMAGSAAAQPLTQVLAVAGSIDEVLNNIRNWLVGILAVLATVCLTIAGARYQIGGSDPGEIEKAKIAFKAACVGYVLAMLAPVIVAVLKSIVGD